MRRKDMKRAAFILVMALVAAAVFASGQSSDAGRESTPGYAPGPAVAAEQTELTGTFDEIDGYPVLRVGGKTYAVGVPGYRWLETDLEPGDEVSVRGFLFEESEPIDGHMRLTAATIDGTEYEIAPPRSRGWGSGPHHGRGWHRGGGYRGGPGGRYPGGPGYTDQPRDRRW
jgi:uncharacterized protein YdeI (BOF family)